MTQSQRHSEGRHVAMEVETGGVRPASARGRRQVPETGTKAGVECLLPLSPREGMGTETSGLQHCERRDFCCFKTQCRGFPGSSAGKESACSAGDPGSIPGSGSSLAEGIGYPTPVFLGYPGGSGSKESSCNVGDWGLIPGLGRSGERNGYPL